MKSKEKIEKELNYQREKIKAYPEGSALYMDTKNIINTLKWVLKGD